MKQPNTYVITGASSDLGRALATYLDADSRIRLVLVSRSDRTPSVSGRHLRLSGIDLTKDRSLSRLYDAVDGSTSGGFTVVHCAGDFWIHRPLVQTKLRDIVSMINSHYVSLAATAWKLLPLLLDRREGGRIVAFSCNSVTYNYPDMAPFTSAKAAVECFVKCIANEYSEYGIVANTLALPTIRTEKVERLKPGGDRANYLTPQDLARLIAHTINTAPSSLNGNTLKVFNHSPSFFHESYFDRNPREQAIVLRGLK